MKVLINLFDFVGGGETIMCNYCDYLHSQNENFIFICKKGSYIDKFCISKNYKVVYWPHAFEEYNFIKSPTQVKNQHEFLEELNKYLKNNNPSFLSNNLRDFYNLCKILMLLKITKFRLLHLIHHPEDTLYLDNWEFGSNKIKKMNEENISYLNKKNSVLINNKSCKENILGNEKYSNQYINLPASEGKFIHNKKEIKDPIKIICISRFVSFKVGSIIKLLKYLQSNKEIRLSIIGYGSFSFLIKFFISYFGLKNRVKLFGRVEPAELSKIIRESDIGYAQGISLLEIVRNGLPCIIAPYSPFKELFFSSYETGGIFGENNPWLGDYSEGQDYISKSSIDSDIDKLRNQYNQIKKDSKSGFEQFNPNFIFPKITYYLNNVRIMDINEVRIPKIPKLKLIAKKIL